MNTYYFISKSEIVPINNFCRVEITLFDKNNNKEKFNTSLMSKYNANKYMQAILKGLNSADWFEVKYGINPTCLTPILDKDKKEIVALSFDGGVLYKNEVSIYEQEREITL